MTKKATSQFPNGVRFQLSAKWCLIEPAGRGAVLEAMGLFTDRRTQFSACSLQTLAALSRSSTRNVNRALADWPKEALEHLVLEPAGRGGGPGAVRLFRVHWERLFVVSRGVQIARRAVMAGAFSALEARGLLKRPGATRAACEAVLTTLEDKVRMEGNLRAAARLEGLQPALSAAFEGWPERVLDPAADLLRQAMPEPVGFAGFEGEKMQEYSPNPDNLSANPDNLSSRGSIDISPQGNPLAREALDFEPVKISLVAALACQGAQRRSELAKALLGCQAVRLDGWLVVRASGAGQACDLNQHWWDDLAKAGEVLGCQGVLVTDRRYGLVAQAGDNPQFEFDMGGGHDG